MPHAAIGDVAIVLNPEDDVAIAKAALSAGAMLEDGDGRLTVRADIPPGHKVARRAVPEPPPATGQNDRRQNGQRHDDPPFPPSFFR